MKEIKIISENKFVKSDIKKEEFSIEEIKNAFILSELLKPPVSVRKRGLRNVSNSHCR